jgi:hypothetical protein
MFGRDCDEQATCGLGVEEDGSEFFGNSFFVADYAFGKVAIILQATGDVASADAIQRPFELGDLADTEA